MNDHIVVIVGYALVFIVCAWGAWFLAVHLRTAIRSGKAIDRTLSEVDSREAPGMYGLQILGYVLLIGAAAAIGIGAIAALAWRIASLS